MCKTIFIKFLLLFIIKNDEILATNIKFDDVPHIFYTKKYIKEIQNSETLPNDLRFMPTLGNGHLGFTVFGESIYLNGVYNGKQGLSHRARIPNYSNISLEIDSTNYDHFTIDYAMNIKSGIFKIIKKNENFKIIQLIYPHRYYNRAIINEMFVYRLKGNGALKINIRHQPGQRTEDIDFSELTTTTITIPSSSSSTTEESDSFINDEHHQEDQQRSNSNRYDNNNSSKNNNLIEETTSWTSTIHLIQGYTRELENDHYQKSRKHVCCLWNHVPEEITLQEDQRFISYRFVMTADELCRVAKQEMTDVLNEKTEKLLKSHWSQWKDFWNSFSISVEDNTELNKAIHGSIFYLANALPSLKTNQPSNPFYGLSPSGLGRGGNDLLDYQGHNFWDTEIWMLPTVTQMNPWWTNQLLEYRFRMLETAKDNANSTGYNGSRFPWESAFTGTEVTNPCCPLVAKQQFHITADIALALQHYFSVTYDFNWLHNQGCPLAENIAKFWSSRVQYDKSTGLYNIKYVMGPDEDHPNVTNNVYTNVVASYALKFGEFAHSQCTTTAPSNIEYSNDEDANAWLNIANKLKILYDQKLDYHPQYEGYVPGEIIKQADVILLGYPILYPMNHSTRENDLRFYENVTRESGPAMTWAMHAINHLDTGNYIKAGELFERGYQNYVRSPFQVWSEVNKGIGAVNFLTGAGGFLQSVINGYAGIRFYLDRMEINQPRLPPKTSKFILSGIKYLGSTFKIIVTKNETILRCKSMDSIKVLFLEDENKRQPIYAGYTYNITASKITIRSNVKFNRNTE